VTLRDAWEAVAENWVAWARQTGHDSYGRFHRDAFVDLLPAPGRRTVDLGCGEGRLTRDLAARGHRMVAVDAAPTMIRHAREADPSGEYHVASAAELPLADAAADLVVAFMSLQDMDDPEAAVREAWRVLEPGGRFCLALVHPLNSAGRFESDEPEAAFVIAGSYRERARYVETVERDGLEMTFTSDHRSLEGWLRLLTENSFLVEAVREIYAPEEPRWSRIPFFLHVRARKST
jgi:ubiquinone/menaquinone biosynthesis C-methylase UbiE